MIYGQLVAVEHGWPAQTARPVIRLRRHRAPVLGLAAMETWSRVAMGAAVGAVFGAATSMLWPWVALGIAVSMVAGYLRDRPPQSGR
jgi:ABC-type siderophore export system fused ATPase/permease subunit